MSKSSPQNPSPERPLPSVTATGSAPHAAAEQPYLTAGEIIELLNELLEGERAGAKVALHMAKSASDPLTGSALNRVRLDEAHFCAVLARHLENYGAEPSMVTGPFKDKVLAEPTLEDQLRLLLRGQRWVIRKIEEALPRIADAELRRDLRDMAEVHQADIESCRPFLH